MTTDHVPASSARPGIDEVRRLERFIVQDGSSDMLLTFQGILRSHEALLEQVSEYEDQVQEYHDRAVKAEGTAREALTRAAALANGLAPTQLRENALYLEVILGTAEDVEGPGETPYTYARVAEVSVVTETLSDDIVRLAEPYAVELDYDDLLQIVVAEGVKRASARTN